MTRAAAMSFLLLASCQGSGPTGDPDRPLADSDRRFTEDGDAAGALAGLDAALRDRPNDADLHAARADLLGIAGRRAEALESYGRTLAIQPRHLGALSGRGLLLADLGRTAEAERDFSAVIATVPGAPDGYLLRAWLERRDGRFSEADRDLAEARARGPGRWEEYYNTGVASARAERWSLAERAFELSLLLSPLNAEAWIALSRARAMLGRPERALEDLDRAARARPDNPASWYARGEILRSLDRPFEAIRAYDRALDLGEIPIIFAGRAQARAAAGDAAGAESDFALALEREPTLREAWVARGRWRASRRLYDGARDDFAAALRLRASASVLGDLARLHHDREQWAPAVAVYESALRICTERDLRPILERDLADARARRKRP